VTILPIASNKPLTPPRLSIKVFTPSTTSAIPLFKPIKNLSFNNDE
jgi:hypothetical protein